MRRLRRAPRAGFASLVLVSACGLAAHASADELPLPGPTVDGPVYKAGDPAAPPGGTLREYGSLGGA